MERNIARLTTASIVGMFLLALAGGLAVQSENLDESDFWFIWLAGVPVLTLLGCSLAGVILTVKYFLGRAASPYLKMEYALMPVAVFMPVVAIYVLRAARRAYDLRAEMDGLAENVGTGGPT